MTKLAVVEEPSGLRRATTLLVVPKSMPMTGIMGARLREGRGFKRIYGGGARGGGY